jgi:hypothetical protein
MAWIATSLVVMALACSPAPATAQDSVPAAPDKPRLEIGAGASIFFSGGTIPYTTWMVDTRVGVKVNRVWSVEGLVHFMPDSSADVAGYYRAHALWRIGRGRVQPFVAFGGAGEFSRYSWPEYHYTDYQTGEPRVIPAGTTFSMTAPFYPTAAVGLEKALSPHLAIRVELTAAFGINDYGVAVALVPAVGLSFPLGRYPSGPR